MKIPVAAVLFAFAGAGLAQSGHDSHHKMEQPAKSAKSAGQTHKAAGVVKSVNTEKGSVTIAHEPVASLKWPSMTMAFKARDRKALEGLKPGAKVEFDFQQQGKDYVISRLAVR